MEFLESLSSVSELQLGIKDIKKSITEVAACVQQVESDFYQKSIKSLEYKQTYFKISQDVSAFKSTKVG